MPTSGAPTLLTRCQWPQLVRFVGSRWKIEDGFAVGKKLAALDEHQVPDGDADIKPPPEPATTADEPPNPQDHKVSLEY